MEKEQLLGTLDKLIARYEQHRSYIDKASSQIGKFSAAVIEKVVLDHEVKSAQVADEINPLLPALGALIVGAEKERRSINASKGTIDEEVQELELRAAIGELSEQEFEEMVEALRSSQAAAADRLAAIEQDIEHLRSIENRWVKIGGATPTAAPVAAAPAAPAAPPPAPLPPVAPAVMAPASMLSSPQPVTAQPVAQPHVEDDDEAEGQVGRHVSHVPIRDDIGVVFPADGSASTPARIATGDDDMVIPTNESEEGITGPEVRFDEDDDGENDVDVFGGTNEIDVEIGNGGGVSVIGTQGDMQQATVTGDSPRRALLLYQEGTPEEQIYPFTGDTLTVGRGRENDIQIKNDSKVSRYHCRLSRQGNNFYIEDVKSSNGTLVNGELITDRRLFGGEEVIIGETFFRFRIME